MTYDPNKAALYNKLIKQGLSEDAAAAQAGIGTNDFGSYAIGDNGELGALIVGTGIRPDVEVVTDRNTPVRVNYAQTASGLPAQQPTPKNITYTTTSTETVSGGGSTTITSGLPQSTPQSRAVQPAIDAKQAEIDQFIKDNPSDFVRKRQGLPPLTAEQNAERQARLNTLEDQRSQLTNRQLGLTTPGTPTITTVPNTTTTRTTVTYGSSASNQDVDFLDDPELSRQSELQIDRTLPPPVSATTRQPSTAPLDDPNAGEAEARAFLQQQQTVQNAQPDTGFTYYGSVPAAPVSAPRSTATVNPNPWAGIDAEKAAAWNQLSAADQRWLGGGDPTDPFILRRAPDGGRPQAAINAVRSQTPAPVDPFAFDPATLSQPDAFAFDETTLVNPGPGYTRSYDEFGNEIQIRTPLPDDNLAYTQGITNTAGYSFEDTGGVPTQRLSDFPVSDTSGYGFEDTGGVPTQTLRDFPVTNTAGYSFTDTGGVPTQTLADFPVTDTSGYGFEDTGGVPTQRLSDFPVSDTSGYNTFTDTGGVPTQSLSDFVNPGPGYTTSFDEFGNEIRVPAQRVQNAQPDPGFTYYGEPLVATPTSLRSTATVDPNPWAGIDAEKAAAWARLSPADQRWLGGGDPTDPFILKRAPDGGRPQAAINAVQSQTPASLPDDNLAFEPPPDDNLAYTQGVNPGPGYTTSYDEFGNEILVQTPLPDDDLAYTQGVSDTSGYSFEDTGGVPTQRLSDFPVTDTSGYSFEDTGGVPTQTLSDFPVTDTAGYSFEDTGGVPTQRLSDFPVTDTAGYSFEDTGGVPTQTLSDFPVTDTSGYSFEDTGGVPTQTLDNFAVDDTAGYGFEGLGGGDATDYSDVADPGPGYGFAYDDNGEFIPADSLQAQDYNTDDTFPGPGYTTTYDEFGNEITFPSELPDDNLAYSDGVDPGPGYGVSDDNLAFEPTFDDNLAFQDTEVEDTEGYIVPDGTINVPESQQEFAPTALGGNFSAQYDVESGTYGVFDEDTGQFVQTGLTEQEATLLAQDASVGDPNFAGNADAFGGDTGVPDVPPSEVAFAPTALGGNFSAAFDAETGSWGVFDNDTGVFVETGLTEQEAILKAREYSVGDPNFAGNPDAATDTGAQISPEEQQRQAEAAAAQAAIAQAAAARKAAQEAVAEFRKQASEGDWRVKLRLAGGADYLYRAPENQSETGILYPLYVSKGVIFPYTPTITTNYGATYNSYDLTHSNFRGYFYQNSFVDEITIQAVFTAQDTTEANYMLAVIHFFRSVTKMFYGQDANRGQPPPLVFLQGLGEFQFNLHPCVVRSFTYSMPNDVDYIRARTANFDGTSFLKRRDRQAQSLDSYSASNNRLDSAGLSSGAATPGQQTVPTLGTKNPTYVPTRMETTITLLPIQTRQQVSQEFSLKRFASGELVKQGYW